MRLPPLTRKNQEEKAEIEKRLNSTIDISAAEYDALNAHQRFVLTMKEEKRDRILAPWKQRYEELKAELTNAQRIVNEYDAPDLSSYERAVESAEREMKLLGADHCVAYAKARLDEHIAAKPDPRDWELDRYLAQMSA